MSSCGESDVAMATGQREPTLLRGCSTCRPVEDVEHKFIAAGEAGEIHGQIECPGVQDRAELRPESLAAVVIGVTSQGYVGVPGATPRNGDRLLGLGVQAVRAAADEIVVDNRIAYRHAIREGRSADADEWHAAKVNFPLCALLASRHWISPGRHRHLFSHRGLGRHRS